jgi:hypothetical protein
MREGKIRFRKSFLRLLEFTDKEISHAGRIIAGRGRRATQSGLKSDDGTLLQRGSTGVPPGNLVPTGRVLMLTNGAKHRVPSKKG